MRDMPLLLPEWPAPGNVRAVSTMRQGGLSQGAFASLNLGMNSGDDPEVVASNRRLLRGRLGLAQEPAWLRQVHGTEIVRAEDVADDTEADATWTSSSGRACAVLVADCLPVLFCDRAGTRVAAAHAGWRGLAGGILEHTVSALQLPPESLLAWLGPCIGQEAFEVGPDVRDAFLAHWPESRSSFEAGRAGRWHADLHAIARLQLNRLGVQAVYGDSQCTASNPDRFFSYRRDGQTGRMASLVWLESATA